VPADPRLELSGQSLCGLFDLNANKVGQVQNVVTAASNYGKQYERWNGVDISTTAHLSKLLVQGGVSTGKTTSDKCDIVTRNPQVVLPAGGEGALASSPSADTSFCHTETPFITQVKLLGSYTLPWDLQAAATYQNVPGPQILGNAVFTSAQIAPSLGRGLSAASTATINVVRPGTLYVQRLHQIDLRLAKRFNIGHARFQGMLDVFNALNKNTDLALNPTYGSTGATWLQPLVILPPRLITLGLQVDF
jgi:hypothetical protein